MSDHDSMTPREKAEQLAAALGMTPAVHDPNSAASKFADILAGKQSHNGATGAVGLLQALNDRADEDDPLEKVSRQVAALHVARQNGQPVSVPSEGMQRAVDEAVRRTLIALGIIR